MTADHRGAIDAFSHLGNPAEIARLLDYTSKLAQANPRNSVAQVLRADVLVRNGKNQEALSVLDTAASLSPNSPLVLHVRGMIRAMAGQLDQANTDLEKAIELQPTSADPYASWGLLLLQRQNLEGAIERFSQAIQQSPDHTLAYTGRGVTYAMMSAWDDAEADLQKAAQLAPTLPLAQANLKFLVWAKAQAAFRQNIRWEADGRGSTLIAQSYDHKMVDLGVGRVMDVFVLKATPQTSTLEGMQDVVRQITQDLRTQNGLPESWNPRFHMDAHGWRSTPFAQMNYAASLGNQAGADAVIALDLSSWYKTAKSLTWSDDVSQAAAQAARANAAINLETKIKPTFSGNSGGAEIIPRLGELMHAQKLPNSVSQNIGFGQVVLAGYPFHKWQGGDVSISPTLLKAIEGRVFNLYTTPGQWSNPLQANDKVANILVTDLGGRGIWHGDWTSQSLGNRPNAALDIAAGALRGWQPETLQSAADSWGRLGNVPTYATSLGRPLAEATAMASMTGRGIQTGGKVLIGSMDDVRAETMLQTLGNFGVKADWQRVSDLSQLQTLAKEGAYSRILWVKDGAPDNVSSALLADAQKMQQPALPSIRPLQRNLDRLNDASGLLYRLAKVEMPPEMKVPLAFTAPVIGDIRAAQEGRYNFWTSESFERAGKFGLRELPKMATILEQQGKLPQGFTSRISPFLAGAPDIAAGAFSQMGRVQAMPTIEEVTHYLDGVNKACWATVGALVSGPEGASIASTSAGLTADIFRGMTTPIFQHFADIPVKKQVVNDFQIQVTAAIGHNTPAMTFSDMFSANEIRRLGFDRKTVVELDHYATWVNASRVAKPSSTVVPTSPASIPRHNEAFELSVDDSKKYFGFFPPPPPPPGGGTMPFSSITPHSRPPDPPNKGGPGGPGMAAYTPRLAPHSLPSDSRSGVYMKTDVVTNTIADTSEMFAAGPTATVGAEPVQQGFRCPFLVFCATEATH